MEINHHEKGQLVIEVDSENENIYLETKNLAKSAFPSIFGSILTGMVEEAIKDPKAPRFKKIDWQCMFLSNIAAAAGWDLDELVQHLHQSQVSQKQHDDNRGR